MLQYEITKEPIHNKNKWTDRIASHTVVQSLSNLQSTLDTLPNIHVELMPTIPHQVLLGTVHHKKRNPEQVICRAYADTSRYL